MAVTTKEQALRQGYLMYFNQVLLDRGIITEQEHSRMAVKIKTEGGVSRKTKEGDA